MCIVCICVNVNVNVLMFFAFTLIARSHFSVPCLIISSRVPSHLNLVFESNSIRQSLVRAPFLSISNMVKLCS